MRNEETKKMRMRPQICEDRRKSFNEHRGDRPMGDDNRDF